MTQDHIRKRFAEEFLPHLSQACRLVAARQKISHADQQDLVSRLTIRLLENDGDAIKAFGHRSSVQTYLITIATRLVLDDRDKRWGKWRPSQAARRLGPTAVELEQLVTRDGASVDHAIEELVTNRDVRLSRSALRKLHEQLPNRLQRHDVPSQQLDELPDPQESPEHRVAESSIKPLARHLIRALDEVRQSISGEERLMLRLRFEDGLTVRQIAQILRVSAKKLYKRYDRLIGRMRDAIVARGVATEDVTQIIHLGILAGLERETQEQRPSNSIRRERG